MRYSLATMDGETFRSRLVVLLQRSRQAHRLYSSMERMQRGEAAEFTEMQAGAWRAVNSELVKQLTAILEAPHSRQLMNHLVVLRDRFLADFRNAEAELNQRHRELVTAAEKGDFIRSAVVSRTLVGLKARSQASQAAYTELEDVTGGHDGAVSATKTSTLSTAPVGAAGGASASGAALTSTALTGAALVRHGNAAGTALPQPPIESQVEAFVGAEPAGAGDANAQVAKIAKIIPLHAASAQRRANMRRGS